jgi:hypothetical protein
MTGPGPWPAAGLVALIHVAGCGLDCVDRVPPGTYTLDPAHIPPELRTDAMEVTIADERVVFHYTTREGEPVTVVYRMEALAEARAERPEQCDRDK